MSPVDILKSRLMSINLTEKEALELIAIILTRARDQDG